MKETVEKTVKEYLTKEIKEFLKHNKSKAGIYMTIMLLSVITGSLLFVLSDFLFAPEWQGLVFLIVIFLFLICFIYCYFCIRAINKHYQKFFDQVDYSDLYIICLNEIFNIKIFLLDFKYEPTKNILDNQLKDLQLSDLDFQTTTKTVSFVFNNVVFEIYYLQAKEKEHKDSIWIKSENLRFKTDGILSLGFKDNQALDLDLLKTIGFKEKEQLIKIKAFSNVEVQEFLTKTKINKIEDQLEGVDDKFLTNLFITSQNYFAKIKCDSLKSKNLLIYPKHFVRLNPQRCTDKVSKDIYIFCELILFTFNQLDALELLE